MLLSEKHFQILETLDGQEISSQRQLAKFTGISLDQINYVLKQFLSKGLIKIGNFRKNPHKIGYASFDLVVEFNSDQDTEIKKQMGISSDRVISLW